MKNKKGEQFSAILSAQSAVKIAGRIPFRVISYVSRAMFLLLAVWIFAVVPVFAESFPNRPTAYELEGVVILGKECVLGANERCYGAQVSPPFAQTNNAGWYLDQNAMGDMAASIRTCVPYYANPDTVYDGTTNITMLSVTGVWAQLDIGNHTNQFTQTFASGTNAAVYGDSPWRITEDNLMERYDVLHACLKRLLTSYTGTSFPEVVRTAKFWGEGTTAAGGYCNVYYGWSYNLLGPANGANYSIEIDNRGPGGSAGAVYITMGTSEGDTLPNNVLEFKLDTKPAEGSGFTTFSSGLTLDADPDYVEIVSCFGYHAGLNCSHSPSSAGVSVQLNREVGDCAHVGFYAVINFPFQYCE